MADATAETKSEGKPTARARAKTEDRDVAIARIEAWKDVLIATVKAVAVVGVTAFVYLSIARLAGKETTVSAVINAVVRVSADRWVAYVIASLCGFAWHRERKLRHNVTAQLGGQVARLEKEKDPNRMSSGMSPKGLPPANDKSKKKGARR